MARNSASPRLSRYLISCLYSMVPSLRPAEDLHHLLVRQPVVGVLVDIVLQVLEVVLLVVVGVAPHIVDVGLPVLHRQAPPGEIPFDLRGDVGGEHVHLGVDLLRRVYLIDHDGAILQEDFHKVVVFQQGSSQDRGKALAGPVALGMEILREEVPPIAVLAIQLFYLILTYFQNLSLSS